ncbi:MAG: chemotaxis protein CheW [Gemmatimonadaceae bacterium]|nr:chemotaxis protein CheW [Gemmatimonadaceae bacterium]
MTAPRFRSTAAFTLRQRQAVPAIDRATFVIFSLGGQRFAAPAEAVERVLREVPSGAGGQIVVEFGGRQVPALNLRQTLCEAAGVRTTGAAGPPHGEPIALGQRTLVFSVRDVLVAAAVDAVYEVATIDAALVKPVNPETALQVVSSSHVIRGQFVRHDHNVLVLDMLRVVRAVYDATHHAALAQAS